MNLIAYLTTAAERGASDVFIVAGRPLSVKVNGMLETESQERLTPADAEELVRGIYQLAGKPGHGLFPAHRG